MFINTGENMNTYEIGLNNEFDVSNLLQAIGTNDIDAVSMIIKADTLDHAKKLYKHEFIKDFGFNILSCEITGKAI